MLLLSSQSPSMIQFPPPARTTGKDVVEFVDEQPARSPAMTIIQKQSPAKRLRGGCCCVRYSESFL